MFEYDELEEDDSCPNCSIGRIRKGSRPYLRLFQGQLFTIPDALIWQCDMCNYYEFDDTTGEIVNQMIFGATFDSFYADTNPPVPPVQDDEASQKGNAPGF